ncbi:dolichol-phosphate mannosyltransferase [Nematocida sp. AWRm80]|nr:dolichol-phosphate mannosyltransferase [Nematocida sp. AWRm80]
MEVSILVPTHNERENAKVLIYSVHMLLKDTKYEIIIIDDGSTDNTAAECNRLATRLNASVQVLERKEKLGLGNAYKRGIEYASGKYIVIMDADLSHDPREIPKLLQKIKETNTEIIIGSRYTKGGAVSNWPLFRRLTSQGANILAQIFTGIQTSDLTNSYRIYKRDILVSSIKMVLSSGFAYQMEVLYRCNTTIKEHPVHFHEREYGVSKLSLKEYTHFLYWGSFILLTRMTKAFHLFIHTPVYYPHLAHRPTHSIS